MNREHFSTFVWLRWRLKVNQFRKAGALNAIFFAIFVACALVASVGLFFVGFAVGLLALKDVPPVVRLFVWDGVVAAFLSMWLIGLLTDLQRAEGLALDKFLHLPVSASGAFLVNYLSSLLSLTLITLVPGMIGLALGQVFATGPAMLLALPLLAAFLLAVTGVTYQFQGWLSSLMANPRRRRTIIVFVTAGVILVAQAPQLLNLVRPWERLNTPSARRVEREAELNRQIQAKEIDSKEYTRRHEEINKEFQKDSEASNQEAEAAAERIGGGINMALPPGWLPLGASGLAEGKVIPALLGTLGLALIGSFSLWRAYRTTVRMYTGHFTAGDRAAAKPAAPVAPADPSKIRLVERRLPWVSEQASAVATAGLRSLTRSPEAKMCLLAPVIMAVVFAGIGLTTEESPLEAVRPVMVLGVGAGTLLLVGLQLIGNQFGYDRTGFRAFVLSPVPRRDILLGKNLATSPPIVGMGLALAALAGIVFPLRIDHYPAVVAQLLAAYLILCLLSNALSILAPIPLAAGSMQPAQIRVGPVLLQFVFLMVLPVAMFPVFLPLGLEALLEQTDTIPRGIPVSLGLSLIVLALTVFFYRLVLTWEGDWLTAREKKILEMVTSKTE